MILITQDLESKNSQKDRLLGFFKVRNSRIKKNEKRFLVFETLYKKKGSPRLENLQDLIIELAEKAVLPIKKNENLGFFGRLKSTIGQLKSSDIVMLISNKNIYLQKVFSNHEYILS